MNAEPHVIPLPTLTENLRRLRWGMALLLLAGLVVAGLHLHAHEAYGRAGSWALLSGAAFGYLLQRSRFCFFCHLADWFLERKAAGVLALLAALAVGALGYTVIFGAWVPYPDAGFLPPRAHIGPAGWHLAVGGLAFGLGMALSGSCLSAHFYRLGEGSVLSPVALLGALGGFILGFKVWPFFYMRAMTEAPVVWLPESLGYAGALLLQTTVLGGLALWVWLRAKPEPARPPLPRSAAGLAQALWVDRWPAWVGGLGVGALATAVYLRATPLGVTAELGRLARAGGARFGWIPAHLPGLDTLRGCNPVEVAETLSPNALFVLGLVGAALIGGLAAGQFKPRTYSSLRLALALIGGVLLGFGSLISLGCTVGTLLSGVHAFALSGWLFAAAMLAGIYGGIQLMTRID